jgi:integrase
VNSGDLGGWQAAQHVGETKTEARQAPVPIITPVAEALRKHRKKNPSTTYVFEGVNQKPLDIATIGAKRVRPALAGTGIEWEGWHAFRRGITTNLRDLNVPDDYSKHFTTLERCDHAESLYQAAGGRKRECYEDAG